MRGLILALALAFGALAPVAGCASLQQLQPQTAREALAVANVTMLGAVNLASGLYDTGVIDTDTARRLADRFEEADRALTLAQNLLAAHDEAAAGRQVNAAMIILRELSNELVRRAQAAGSVPA